MTKKKKSSGLPTVASCALDHIEIGIGDFFFIEFFLFQFQFSTIKKN